MLNTTNNNSEYLHNYIRRVAKQEQETVDTSSVYTGTIEAAQSGIYTIVLNQSDNSSSVLAIPIVSGDIYDKDDSVYLLRANTTATVNYFIVGKVNAIQEAFFNLTELERFNPNESKVDLVFENSNVIDIKYNESNIFDSIRNLGYFQLEMKITSKVEDSDKIIIYLNYTNESQYEAKFVFSSYEFIGQPGGDNYTLIQKKIFHLPSNINIKNIRIEKVGGFSVGAMNIVAGSLLEVSAAYQNNIIVQNDRNYFEKEIPNVSNPLNIITLTSKIYYNNKPLVGEALQYYWFLKDDSAVNPESSDYLDIEGAGNGWRCLNIFTLVTTADGQEIRLWDNKNNFIVLNKTNEFVNFSNFVNKVKCIVKYFDNFIESDLIDIYNYDYEQFIATLNTNVDPIVIINREDSILLECKVTNNNSKIDLNNFVYKYEWHLGDAILSNLKDSLVKIQDKTSTTLKEEDKQDNVREMENDIEEYYCKVSIYHKNDVIDGEVIEGKQPISKEISNTIQVTSAAAATDIQEEVRYKYYIADNHSVTFEENIQASEDTELSKWSGDWDIYDSNVTKPTWTDGSFEVVFNDLNLFNNKDKTKEYFIYYTKRTVVRQGLKILRKETGSFPQIARSVIYGNGGWKNYRVGNITNQLNTFNQLTNNGEDDGIYYSDIPELVLPQEELDWATTYYKKIISPQGEISYQPVQLTATIGFIEDLDYYIYNNEEKEYDLVSSEIVYDESTDYYKKINDNEYQKLVINTQNFDITNIQRPEGVTDLYKNIDNKLFINATYIRSGTLEVNNKFYASIDKDDVRIAGFNVDSNSFSNKDGSIYIGTDGVRFTKEKLNADIVLSIEIYYLQNDSPGNKPLESDSNWSKDYPNWENGKYIWQKTITYYANNTHETQIVCITGAIGPQGETGAQGPQGEKGEQGAAGKYIKQIIEQYYLSDSNTVPNTAIWIDITENSILPIEKGKLRFRRQKYIWSDNSITYSVARMDETDQRIVDWCSETDTTLIDGGSIYAHSISSAQLATNSIKSLNYDKVNTNIFSTNGTFLDLENGNIYSKKLSLIDGTLSLSGKINSQLSELEDDIDNTFEYLITASVKESHFIESFNPYIAYYQVKLNPVSLHLDDCYKIISCNIESIILSHFFTHSPYQSAYPNVKNNTDTELKSILNYTIVNVDLQNPNHTLNLTFKDEWIRVDYYNDTAGSQTLSGVLLKIKISGKKTKLVSGGEINLDPGTSLSFPNTYIDFSGASYFKTAQIGSFNISEGSLYLDNSNINSFWPIIAQSKNMPRGSGIYLGRDGLNISDICTISTETGLLQSLNTSATGTFKYFNDNIQTVRGEHKEQSYILGKENLFKSSSHTDTCQGLFIYNRIYNEEDYANDYISQTTYTRVASDGLYTTLISDGWEHYDPIYASKKFFGYTYTKYPNYQSEYYDSSTNHIQSDSGMLISAVGLANNYDED